MKNLFLIFSFVLALATQSFAIVGAPASKTVNPTPKKATASFLEEMGVETVADFLALTPKKIKAKTGKRLGLSKRIALKIVQKRVKKAIKRGEMKAEDAAAGKSQLVALLLCLFVGTLGIHRFYLGYTTIGIIQILTFGGLGIWTLIDLIRIVTGDLKPKNGEYAKTLND